MEGSTQLDRSAVTARPRAAENLTARHIARSLTPPVMAPGASVVIVNYNAGTLLRRCVERLYHASGVRELVVVDNASSDGSLEGIRPFESGTPSLRVVRLANNIGFASAVNLGGRLCSGDWLLLVNPDCVVEPGAVNELLAAANDPCVGVVGGLLRNPDGSEQRGCRRRLPTIGNSLGRLLGAPRRFGKYRDLNLTDEPLPTQPCPVEAVSGAMMLVRVAAMTEVGGLDEGYFLHCEDLDLCRRLRDRGWQVRFAPASEGVHRQGSCSEGDPLAVLWHKHRGMARYFRKHGTHRPLSGMATAALYLRFLALIPRVLFNRPRRHPRGTV